MKDEVWKEFDSMQFLRPLSFILSPSSFPLVPLAVPYWTAETYRSIGRSLLSGAIVDGPDLDTLKKSLVERLVVEDATLCGSGSLALELALRACDVRACDEVIIPVFCCSAVVPPVLALSAVPVLADIGPELNLTAETVYAAITKKTKAVVVPHLFGNPADIESIAELARAKKIRVIDDAAQALGATTAGRSVGSFGDAGVVSFGDERVCFGIGGGAVISNRVESMTLYGQGLSPTQPAPVLRRLAGTLFLRRWRRWTRPLHSVLSSWRRADPDAPPAPYGPTRMANLQAAVALSLVQTLEENITARRARVDAYRDLLGNEAGLELIPHRPGSACLTQVVRVSSGKSGFDTAARLIGALGECGYEVQGSYVPIHLLARFQSCLWDPLHQTERVWGDLIELPCEPSVDMNEVERISSLVKRNCRANAATRVSRTTTAFSTASDRLC
jgi:dTDP-4-amino-4,6-dideoxygalactose transaminase